MKHLLRMIAVPLAAAGLSMMSCGGDDTPRNIVIDTNGIQVSDLLVNVPFDTVLSITNDGGTTLTIYDISVSNPANIAIDLETPFTVEGGQTVDVGIALLLTTSTRLTDTLVVTNSDNDNAEIAIPVVLTTRSYDRVQTGWQKFEADNFAAAAADFNEAVGLDANYAEAFAGHGWCLLRLDQLTTALGQFASSVGLGGGSTANSGKSIADLNLGNHADAVSAVDAVVTITSGTASPYTFVHDTSITERDLVWIKARAHYLLGQFAQAQIAVDVLAPGNGLDPSSPTYEADLATLIETLRPTI